MLQTFTLQEIAQLVDWDKSNDMRFEYVTSLRMFSAVAHNAKEPFSLRAYDSQPPIVDDALDAEAERRALLVVWLLTLLPEDTKGVEPKDVVSKEIIVDDHVYDMTPEFAARCVWWIAVYISGGKLYPPEWYERLSVYLKLRWPQFNNRPVTEDLVSEWLIWRDAQMDENKKPKNWFLCKLFELKVELSRKVFALKLTWANMRYSRRRRK